MFHVGNARFLLYNWALAKQSGGTLVLRVEDTDAERSKPEWVQGILDAMAWRGRGAEQPVCGLEDGDGDGLGCQRWR